ncbi:MAG: hypothetical protein M3065_02920 [Actinomycetota bacterium]|nr:hypothetical protein [Actinomycetota bacterium]
MIAIGALAALVPALAPAARPTPSVTVQLVGSLTIAWQGDQARGCAAEGLCGVSGSLQMLPGSPSSSSPGSPPIEIVDSGAAARVTELSATGATEATCADVVPVDFELVVKHASSGGLRALVSQASSPQLPSAGRCAGPTAADLSSLALPARKMGSHGYDLSGRTSFGAGPFTVTAISTMRALFSRGTGGFGGLGGLGGLGSVSTTSVGRSLPAPKTHTELQEQAQVEYRIAGISGALTTTFAGLAPPLCDPVGACGTTGSLSESFTAGGRLTFFGSRIVKRQVGSGAALADLSAGRLRVDDSFGGIPMEATASETVAGPGGATCSDRHTEGPFAGQSRSRGRQAIELQLAPGGQPSLFATGGLDALRTRCPGPSSADVLGSSPLATATLPVSALGAGPLTVPFRGKPAFTGTAYAGQRGGSVVLLLVLVHSSGGTSRVPVFPFPRVP